MKKLCAFFILLGLFEQAPLHSNLPLSPKNLEAHPEELKGAPPKNTNETAAYHEQLMYQADYFFNNIPHAEPPASIVAEMQKVFKPLLELVSPLDSQETQPERAKQVMKHISQFYGLLYLLAEEEHIAKKSATIGIGKNTKLNTETGSITAQKLDKPLTAQQLKESAVWQNHLKIMAASSYDEELLLLAQVHEHEKAMFSYLPQFEVAYYQKAFVQVRKACELTRMYLILVDKMRNRFLADITRTSDKPGDWGDLLSKIDATNKQIKTAQPQSRGALYKTLMQQKNQLFQLMVDFKKSDFYKVTMQFENLDWSKTTPVNFTDPEENPITLLDVIKKGYNFSDIFHTEKQSDGSQKVVVQPLYTLMLEPSYDGKTLNFTALGNILFSGTVSYKSTQTHDGKTVPLGHFNTEPLFDKFFVKDENSGKLNPTLGYLELLSFTSMRLLHTDTSALFKISSTKTSNIDEFDGGNLEKTCQRMVPTELPNFIAKVPSDYAILYDIAKLQQFFANEGITNDTFSQGCWDSVTKFFKDLGDYIAGGLRFLGLGFIVDAAEAIWKGIKTAAKAIFEAIKDVGNAVWHAIKAVAYGIATALYYATAVLPMMICGVSAKDAMKYGESLQNHMKDEIDSATKDLGKAVADATEAAKTMAHAAVSVGASVLKQIDSKLGEDVEGLFDSMADGVLDFAKDSADMVIEVGSSVVKLTAEAVDLAAKVVSNVVGTLVTGDSGGWASIGDDIVSMARDTASAVLGYVTLAFKQMSEAFKSAMKSVGYFVGALVDTVADVGAAVGAALGLGSFTDIKKSINKHRRLISGIITTAILVGVTIATGGAATPFTAGLLAVNVGMMAMNIAGDEQQDEAAAAMMQQQHAFVQDYKEFVTNNVSVLENFQTQKTIEELVQFQAESMNKERALLYYQNYLNEQFNNSLSQTAYYLGKKTTDAVYPSSNGTISADPGALYGVQTGRMSLGPSSGFTTYNLGRGTFAQEAALEPMIVPNQNDKNIMNANNEVKTFWFEQKDLANIPKEQPLQADIVWRSIYEYNGPFHIGIFLTERWFDTGSFNDLYNNFYDSIDPNKKQATDTFSTSWQDIDTFSRFLLGYDHLAKMFVCYRNNAPSDSQETPQLGIYMHEAAQKSATPHTNGWLQTNFKSITFKRGTWYRMQAKLEDTKLTTAFWPLGTHVDVQKITTNDTPPATAVSTTVTIDAAHMPEEVLSISKHNTSFSGSMGVITSGAAVEYKVIEPSKVVVVTKQGEKYAPAILSKPQPTPARLAANKQIGQNPQHTQEKAVHKDIEQQLSPAFGSYSLTALSQQALMQSQFVYKTKGTFSTTTTDYVIFVRDTGAQGDLVVDLNNTAKSTTSTGKKIGIAPNENPTGIMSLVSGMVYNSSGTVTGQENNPLALYQKRFSSLSTSTLDDIKASQKIFLNSMTGPFKLKNITLTGNSTAMANGAFVYNATAENKQDYFVMASMNAWGVNKTGQAFIVGQTSSNIAGMVSLVTGKVYTLQVNGITPKVLSVDTLGEINFEDAQTVHDVYDTYAQQLETDLQKTIAAARTTYQEAQKTLSNEKKLEQDAQKALNKANTTVTDAQSQMNFAFGDTKTKLTQSVSATQISMKALQDTLKVFKTAVTQNKQEIIAPAQKALTDALAKTTSATTATSTAVTAALKVAASGQSAPTKDDSYDGYSLYGSSSNSTYGQSSAPHNPNTSPLSNQKTAQIGSQAYDESSMYDMYSNVPTGKPA